MNLVSRFYGSQQRVVRHLLAALTMSAPVLATGGVFGSTMVGCADESAPETWVKRLEDPIKRSEAIKRLSGMFESASNDAKKNREDPKFKALLDTIVEPLAKQYATGTLDEKTRKELIKLLADTRDPRAIPAFTKAFNDHETGKNDDDAKSAAQAITALAKDGKATDKAGNDALWTCFTKYKPSKQPNMAELPKALREAVLAVKDPGYGPKAVEKLSVAVDPKNVTEAMDQLNYVQLVSIQVIGDLKYTAGAKALVSLMLTPEKGQLRATASSALSKIPAAAEPQLIAAINGTDPDFVKLSAGFGAEKTHLAFLADTLGYISRPKCKDALVQALAKADNEVLRAMMAQPLIRFPSDAKLTEAYVAAYTKLPANLAVPMFGGADAKGALLQASSGFYMPDMTKWVLKELTAAKGEQADIIHAYGLEAAIKLMQPEDAADVAAAVNKFGSPLEKEKLKNAMAAVDKCKKDAACYVGLLDEPVPSSKDTSPKYKAIKATWMAAIHGNEKTKKDLLGKLDKVRDGDVRLGLVQAIDHLAPGGDVATADVMDKLVATEGASGNKEVMMMNDAVVKTALKLRARAVP
jgi:hypothetical protein